MKSVREVMRRDPGQIVQRPQRLPASQHEVIDVNAGGGGAPLYLTRQEIGELGYKQVTNWQGQRVWVSPLCWDEGEPLYAPLHEHPDVDPTGERHRARQAEVSRQCTQRMLDRRHEARGRTPQTRIRGFDD